MTIKKHEFIYRMPTIEELYALECEARRIRSQAVSAFIRDAFKSVKRAFSRTATAPRSMKHA